MTQLTFRVANAFFNVEKIAQTRTGMEIFKLYTLWSQVAQACKGEEGDILEVGCGPGGSGFVIAASAILEGHNNRIILCDTFKGLVKSNPEIDTHHRNMDLSCITRNEVVEFLNAHGLRGVDVIQGTYPDDFQLEGMKYRFVHIDVDIYQSGKDAFEAVWPRMVKGGVVVFDDYLYETTPGITKLIGELEKLPDSRWFFNGMGQAVAVKL